jgi:hypothetical protein
MVARNRKGKNFRLTRYSMPAGKLFGVPYAPGQPISERDEQQLDTGDLELVYDLGASGLPQRVSNTFSRDPSGD